MALPPTSTASRTSTGTDASAGGAEVLFCGTAATTGADQKRDDVGNCAGRADSYRQTDQNTCGSFEDTRTSSISPGHERTYDAPALNQTRVGAQCVNSGNILGYEEMLPRARNQSSPRLGHPGCSQAGHPVVQPGQQPVPRQVSLRKDPVGKSCSPSNGSVRQIHSRTTSFTGHSQCGFLFDVTARHHAVAICAVSFIPGTQDGDYDIWTSTEHHERVHQNAKAWTLVGKGSHVGPRGSKLRIPLHRHVQIPGGERHAFYISGHNVNAVCFSTESFHSNSAEDQDVVVHLGHFKTSPWEGVLSTGPFGHNGMQEFVGCLEYQVLQLPSADHVVQTVTHLWNSRPFPDAELLASDGRKFCVHRSVLAAASPYLGEAWTKLPELPGKMPELVVDAPSETVEALMRFIYTGDEGDTTDPGEMLRLAHLYGLPALVRCSATRLASQLSAGNAVLSVRALRPYREHFACEAAWQMMLANVQSLLVEDGSMLEEMLMSV
eukprot:TRINITY_DN12304_c0_g2_i1.p1 TRINITY_DN12304_c0_g2~~TRINITY_DN12304_c0_g2_i1.p1  ORF type:complete len:563 (+),score=71.31 TRINITY_DN12304_c0_g2_i1:211-1689(+)